MSGGSLEYIFRKIDELADMIDSRSRTPLHRAYASHLRKCAKAAHDLEWVFSCDYGEGDEVEAINAVLQPGAALEQTLIEAKAAFNELQSLIAEAEALTVRPPKRSDVLGTARFDKTDG